MIQAKLWKELDDTMSLDIKLDELAIVSMYEALNRALNCWPDKHPDLLELCDKLEEAANEINARRGN